MELAIIGLPQSGKTTIFSALTKGPPRTDESLVSPRPGSQFNIGIAKVEDERLKALEGILKPKKTVPAEIVFLDMALMPAGFGKGEGFGGPLLNQLSQVDALALVIRSFNDDSISHISGSIDPLRDIGSMNLELAFSDLTIIEKRIQKVKESLKGARSPEREKYLQEQSLLERLREGLEKEKPVRRQELSPEERKYLENYQFLTLKPLLVVLNIGEESLTAPEALFRLEKEAERTCFGAGVMVLSLCGKLERELLELSEGEAREFRASLNLGPESGLKRLARASFELLGLITFFTVVSNELKAWTIGRQATALKAAGKIHSDIERGFIKAEVISFEEFMKCGSMSEARKRGLLRLEGKSYIVRDGDIITFLFNT